MKKIDFIKGPGKVQPIKPVDTTKLIKTAVGVTVAAGLLGAALGTINKQ